VVEHPDVLATIEAALADHFGHRPQRASVSFVGVEPIEVLRFEPIPDERAYVSLGMARRPMTGADASVQAADGPRAELLLSVRDPAGRHADLWRRLAVLAAAPAVEGVVYAPGMTVDLGEPLSPNATCTGAVVTESAIPAVQTPAGAVAILQLDPATPAELAWCRVRGSEALRARWAQAGTDLFDLTRRPVHLGD
jgi:hypothetical protein